MRDIVNPWTDYLINPRIKLRIISDTDVIFEATNSDLANPYKSEISDLYMDCHISKDMKGEPNTADVTIYGLGSGSRERIVNASEVEAPIEISLTPYDTDELSLAFKGEIISVKNQFLNPGHATEIHCTSQKTQHLSVYMDRITYKKGTPINVIVNDFTDAIGMPVQSDEIPTSGILLSQSFGGPAFPLLKRFVEDMGLYCYINDGVLHISSIYVPPGLEVKSILSEALLGTPMSTEISDRSDVEMRTVSRAVNIDPFKKIRRRKKKTKEEKVVGKTDYVQYTVVDQSIPGMDFELRCRPDLQPDDVVKFPENESIKSTLFRVDNVQHIAENEYFDNWTTLIETRVFDPSGEDALAGLI